jgi:FkbM family methyltransferase
MIKYIINKILKKFTNKEVVNSDDLVYLKEFHSKRLGQIIDILDYFNLDNTMFELLKASKSQLLQDIFCLLVTKLKREGFFVEFGATDGINLSNTYILEKNFGWKGILAEPCKKYHQDLLNNRNCSIDLRCVYKNSREHIVFKEANIGELSTIYNYANNDLHKDKRADAIEYLVETVSLEDLLDKYKSPKYIDYLSIDTEGSEYDILSSFNFDTYKFGVITVEHNYTINREKINKLLESQGYKRILTSISDCDDWYITTNPL